MGEARAVSKKKSLAGKAQRALEGAGGFCGASAKRMCFFKKRCACCGGDLSTVQTFVRSYIEAGADHVVLRLVGDHQAMLPELIDVLKSD